MLIIILKIVSVLNGGVYTAPLTRLFALIWLLGMV